MKKIYRLHVVLAFVWCTFSAQAQAPASFRGSAIFQTITSGDGSIFAASGYTVVLVANAANSYTPINLTGNIGTAGTFTYSVSGADALLTANDKQAGSFSADYTFTDSASGAFLLSQNPSAFQDGSFTYYSGQAPASLAGKTFYLSVIDGGGGNQSSGTATLIFSTGTVKHISDLDGSSNTANYTYSIVNKSTGKAQITSGTVGSCYFSFSDSSSGAYALTKSDGSWELGLFTIPDTTPPTVTFTLPTANQIWSNDVFTVAGKASDDVGVSEVIVSSDGSTWVDATSPNGWTNWTAEVSLIPGTNTIYAAALDFNGNYKTNTTKIIYILSAQLTVNTNGKGSISPALNNALLPIGRNYTLTATPTAGFGFANWTDANNTLLTNKPALTFLMASNLAFTANFVDIAKPTVSITNLPASGSASNELFLVKGKAGDNVAVTNLVYNLNNSGWNGVITTNSYTNWFATLDLTPGTNLIATYAVDSTGNVSLTNTVKLVYVLSAQLSVSTNGKGSISPAVNNALLQIGKNYTLTAAPALGFVFTNWTDANSTIITNKPALTFLMASNLSFTANFVDVSKPVLTVTTPTAATSAGNEFYLASGKASDNWAVTNVYYNVNNLGWFNPSTSNHWSTWSMTLDLTPGTNYFAAYAVDMAGNLSATNNIKFIYATAPATLSGLAAQLTPDDAVTFGTPFGVGFGGTTFSSTATDTDTNNLNNGAGSYTYTRQTPSTGQLKITYAAPPSVSNVAQTITLAFTAPQIARFTNGADAGGIVFTSTPTLVQPAILNQRVVMVDGDGDSLSIAFPAGKCVTSNLLTHAIKTNTTYAYTTYGPAGALLKYADTNGQRYVMFTFLGTNYGTAYSENYDATGSLADADQSVFGFASQRAGGNAPTNLVNRSALLFNDDYYFKLTFPDAVNFVTTHDVTTNGIGTYLYAPIGTNAGNMDLNYDGQGTASIYFQFVSPNFAIVTNSDNTLGAAFWK